MSYQKKIAARRLTHYDQRIGTRAGPGTFYGRIPWIDYGIPQRVFCDGSALFGCGLWDALGYGGVGIASTEHAA